MATPDPTGKDIGGPSKNWYRDRYEAVITQRNFLGIVAIASLLLALVSGCIILYMLPQKTVLPFLIQVDEKSGYTSVIEQNSLKKVSADESLRRYFVVKYVTARESYDSADLSENMDIVRLLSLRELFVGYWREVVNAQNKESLYATLGAERRRQVTIKSVVFLDADRAQVRLSTTTSSKTTSHPPEVSHYIALVKFEFTSLDLTPAEMAINPIGFRVTEYRLDKDSSF